jgi:hypothetical protein
VILVRLERGSGAEVRLSYIFQPLTAKSHFYVILWLQRVRVLLIHRVTGDEALRRAVLGTRIWSCFGISRAV